MTCTSASNSQLTGNCAANFYKDTTGAADVCTATITCGNTDSTGSTPRAATASATAQTTCAACASPTWAALATDNCAAWTTCGNQAPVGSNTAVTRLTGNTAIAAGTCAACTSGTTAASGTANCAAPAKTCADVDGAGSGTAAYSCPNTDFVSIYHTVFLLSLKF